MLETRLSSKVKKGDRITLEADSSNNPDAVYALLDQVGKSVPLNIYDLTQVELAAWVATETKKRSKRVTFSISYPNSCSLKYDEIGLKLRDMLAASGIEPKEPDEDTEEQREVEA
jgi:hypothetical protein